MSNKDLQRAIQAEAITTGRRFCSACQMSKFTAGGEWIHSADGRTRRWRCNECVKRAAKRAQDGTPAA